MGVSDCVILIVIDSFWSKDQLGAFVKSESPKKSLKTKSQNSQAVEKVSTAQHPKLAPATVILSSAYQ